MEGARHCDSSGGATGKVVGAVTSFAFTDADFNYTVIAAVDASFVPPPGSSVQIARAKPEKVKTGLIF